MGGSCAFRESWRREQKERLPLTMINIHNKTYLKINEKYLSLKEPDVCGDVLNPITPHHYKCRPTNYLLMYRGNLAGT